MRKALLIALTVILALLAGCSLSARPDPDAPLAAFGPAPSAEAPRLFAPGRVSTPLVDWGLTFAPDGREIFYTVQSGRDVAIVSTRYEDGAWSEPRVAPFSGVYRDECPNMSPDGRRIVFVSGRPAFPGDASKDPDLWVVERKGSGWGEPRVLSEVNGDGPEMFPFLHRSGDLYFCAPVSPQDRTCRIWVARFVDGRYRRPERLRGAVNTDLGEYCPFVSPDGTWMIVEVQDAPDGLGGGDLCLSRKAPDGSWGAPVNLGPVFNSPAHDCYPVLSPGGRFLVYISCRKPAFRAESASRTWLEMLWNAVPAGDEPFDFYWIDVRALDPFLK